mmetsp:Transcript_19665/g.38074  ORF Transcript_19665/g.38074 Transcript_19665/m.38074 type:complete len:314 (-) Transcript_19665:88-1029(-)
MSILLPSWFSWAEKLSKGCFSVLFATSMFLVVATNRYYFSMLRHIALAFAISISLVIHVHSSQQLFNHIQVSETNRKTSRSRSKSSMRLAQLPNKSQNEVKNPQSSTISNGLLVNSVSTLPQSPSTLSKPWTPSSHGGVARVATLGHRSRSARGTSPMKGASMWRGTSPVRATPQVRGASPARGASSVISLQNFSRPVPVWRLRMFIVIWPIVGLPLVGHFLYTVATQPQYSESSSELFDRQAREPDVSREVATHLGLAIVLCYQAYAAPEALVQRMLSRCCCCFLGQDPNVPSKGGSCSRIKPQQLRDEYEH